jgi:hypothetical protein
LDPLGAPTDTAIATAEHALAQLFPVIASLQAIQTVKEMQGPALPLIQLDASTQAVAEFELVKTAGVSSPRKVLDFAARFEKLKSTGEIYCQERLPEFLDMLRRLIERLSKQATKQSNKVWPQKLDAQLCVVIPIQVRNKKGQFSTPDLRVLTFAVVPVVRQAYIAMIVAPQVQRAQLHRARSKALRRPTLVKAIDDAQKAVEFLKAHSFESPQASIDDLARTQGLLSEIDNKTKSLQRLARPGQTEWDEFEAGIDELDRMYSEARRLSRNLSLRQLRLSAALDAIKGHLKWLRAGINELIESAPNDMQARLTELDSRLCRFEAFDARKPYTPWPQASVIDSALIVIQEHVKHLQHVLNPGRPTTSENSKKNWNLASVDAALLLLPQ